MSTLRRVLERSLCYVRRDLEVGNLYSVFNTLRYEFWREGCFIEVENDEAIDYSFVAECRDGRYRVTVDVVMRTVKIAGPDSVEIKP